MNVLVAALATAVALLLKGGDVAAESSFGGSFMEELLQSPDTLVEVDNFFDMELAGMRQAIALNDLDPLDMPSDEDTFTITLFNQTMNGSVWLGDGKLTGLSTVHRSGNMTLSYGLLQNELIVEGEVGMIGLKLQYAGSTEVGFMGSQFEFEFGIPFLSLNFKTDVFISQADVVLEYCFIDDFSYSHVNLSGFGPADTPIYELVVNMLLQVLNEKVSEGVEDTVCSLLERAIQGSGQLVM